MRNTRADDQAANGFERAIARQITNLKTFTFGNLAGFWVVVPTDRYRPAGMQSARRRQPRPPQSQNGHVLTRNTLNRDHDTPLLRLANRYRICAVRERSAVELAQPCRHRQAMRFQRF